MSDMYQFYKFHAIYGVITCTHDDTGESREEQAPGGGMTLFSRKQLDQSGLRLRVRVTYTEGDGQEIDGVLLMKMKRDKLHVT